VSETVNFHGTGVVLDDIGVLLRGPSGAGKSLLALALIERWTLKGRSASLVADDQVHIAIEGDRLVMSTPPAIAGLIELRGRGVIERPYRERSQLHLIVDLVDDYERMPEESAFRTALLDVDIARAPVPKAGLTGLEHQVFLVAEAISALDAQVVRP